MNLLLISAFVVLQSLPAQPANMSFRVTEGKSQIGCDTTDHYRDAHSSTYQPKETVARVSGCFLLEPGTPLTDLKRSASSASFGASVPVNLYSATIDGKSVSLWLSPGSVEPASRK
jgi:hypothetical protein